MPSIGLLKKVWVSQRHFCFHTFYRINAINEDFHVGITLRFALVEKCPRRVEVVSPVNFFVLILIQWDILTNLVHIIFGF